MATSVGTVLGGRYELTERIAGGGMGEVWRAQDDVLGRAVAVKVIRPSLADDASFIARFRNEARLAARLTHGNIAQVYDFGESDETAYIVMELVQGSSVADLTSRGALPPRQVADLVEQAAAGLEAAHDEGMVHRDVKPANMLLTRKGVVKLTDFGIARALGEAKVTRTGEVLGTVHYLSPEAAVGLEADPQSDVYSLAVVAYELLAGRRPFHADSAVSLALLHVNEPPPPLPPSVPPRVAAAVLHGLAKDPDRRPRGTVAFARELRAAADGQPATSGPQGAGTPPPGSSAHQTPPAAPTTPAPTPRPQPQPQPQPWSMPGPSSPAPQPNPYAPSGFHGYPGYPRPAPQQGSTARGIAQGWVVAAVLTALACLLPFASYQGDSWNLFQLSSVDELTEGADASGDFVGWLLAVPMLIVAAMGLPAALRRPHVAWPLVAIPGCLWSALIYLAGVGTVTGDSEVSNPPVGSIGLYLVPLFGTLTLGLVIAAAIKRR